MTSHTDTPETGHSEDSGSAAEGAAVGAVRPASGIDPGRVRRRPTRLNRLVTNASLLFIWAILIAVFGIIEPSTFLTMTTLRIVLAAQAITAIMALALVMPIAANTFDLSIAGAMGLSVCLSGALMANVHVDPILAIAMTLGAGVLIGLFNGLVVVGLRVNSFIATLASGSILEALLQWISGGNQIVSGIPSSFTKAGQNTLFTIPLPFFYMLGIAAIMWYVMEFRQIGRYLYATGSNADAARLAGVRTSRLVVISLVVSGVVAALAGILFVMRIGATSVDAGQPYLLPAFAAAFLGATQFKEGNVNVLGTVVSVYVLATGVQGLELAGAPFWVDDLFNGVALILAVGLAVRSGRQRALA